MPDYPASPRRNTTGQLVTIVSGQSDEGERLFALNFAYARKLQGADVLLIDGVASPLDTMRLRSSGARYGLLDAIADRDQLDRSLLVAAVLGADATDGTRLPVLHCAGAVDKISSREIMEFLPVALSMFDLVVVSIGDLGRDDLLKELLPVSSRVFLLTTQDRSAVRASHALLLQADPARRWRDRVTVVVDCYESSVAPTAMQITETIGVSASALLPIDPQTPGSTADALLPLVINYPDAAYSAAVSKIASTSETSLHKDKASGVAKPRARQPNNQERRSAAGRIAAALTFAYLAVATPSLIGADLFFIMGRDLGIIGLPDLAFSNLLLAAVFLVVTSTLVFWFLRRHFNQKAGVADQLQAVTQHALTGIAFTDAAGTIRYANPMFRRLLNVSQSATETTRLDALLASRMGGADPRELLGSMGEGRTTVRIKSGGQQELDLTLAARRVNVDGADLGWVVNVQDTTAGRAFRETAAITTSVLEVAADGISVVDLSNPKLPLIYVNKAFEETTGWNRMEAIGKNARFLQGSDRLQPEIAAMARAIKLRKPITVTLRNYRKDGTMFWNRMNLAPVLDQKGRSTHYIAIQHDVTHQRYAAEQLEKLAYFDSLTELPNRTRFRRQLGELIAASANQPILIVRIDIQRLHDVNTAAGYERGDALLLELSQRLKQGVPGGLVGRLDGKEFAVATPADPQTTPEVFVRTLQALLLQRYDVPGASLHVTFAMGFTVVTNVTADIALRQADIAAHEAGGAGPNAVQPFDSATEALILTRTRMTAELQQSLESDDFRLHYQPKVDLVTGDIVGAEALVRWEHPVFGLQRPDRFIPLAEQTGLIVELGARVFSKAARMAAALHRAGQVSCPISVNVSAFQFRQADLLEVFDQALADAGADASWITLELTESVFAATSDDLIAKLQAARARGYGLSIDDFGTGYSSLRYLKNFPVSEIKLDRSFISALHRDAYNSSITQAVLTIGAGLAVDVVAEGIETMEEYKTLLDLGCRYGQGFLFSKPLEGKEFLNLLTTAVGLPWRPRVFAATARTAAPDLA